MRFQVRIQQPRQGICIAEAQPISKSKTTRTTASSDNLMQALSQACQMPRLELTSDEDELLICRAMLRNKAVICETVGSRLRVIEMA